MVESKGMKFAVLVFSAVLIIAAAAAITVSAEQQKTVFPINGSVGQVAISWYYPDYEELVLDSNLIAVVSVSDKFSVWGTVDGTKPPRYALCDYWIYTCYSFDRFDVINGEMSDFYVRAPGGTADGYTMTIQPTPEFEIGDTVLLFLNTTYADSYDSYPVYPINPSIVFVQAENGTFVNEYHGEVMIDLETNDVHLIHVHDDSEKENYLLMVASALESSQWDWLFID